MPIAGPASSRESRQTYGAVEVVCVAPHATAAVIAQEQVIVSCAVLRLRANELRPGVRRRGPADELRVRKQTRSRYTPPAASLENRPFCTVVAQRAAHLTVALTPSRNDEATQVRRSALAEAISWICFPNALAPMRVR